MAARPLSITLTPQACPPPSAAMAMHAIQRHHAAAQHASTPRISPGARGFGPLDRAANVRKLIALLQIGIDELENRVTRRDQVLKKRGLAGAVGPGDQMKYRHVAATRRRGESL